MNPLPLFFLLLAGPAAQEVPADQLSDHAQVVRQGILTRSLLRHRDRGRAEMLSPEARATCANKGRAAARLGRNDLKVRQLYALCARAGA